jgi:DtxR family Mn-dependent transcriptional regulator
MAAEGDVVRPGKLATWLAVSPPTITEAMHRLQRDGWVEINNDRSIILTTTGKEAAENLVRHHRILERWLTDVLGLDWASADDEADRLSSAISDFLIDRIDTSLKRPTTCPHGNPIPGREVTYGTLFALATLEQGATARVRRISEVAEHESRELLTALSDHQISEGSSLEVLTTPSEEEGLVIEVTGRHLALSMASARLIWVEIAV